jgi:hypothetical protein
MSKAADVEMARLKTRSVFGSDFIIVPRLLKFPSCAQQGAHISKRRIETCYAILPVGSTIERGCS